MFFRVFLGIREGATAQVIKDGCLSFENFDEIVYWRQRYLVQTHRRSMSDDKSDVHFVALWTKI